MEFAGGALRCGEYVTLRKVGDTGFRMMESSGEGQFRLINNSRHNFI